MSADLYGQALEAAERNMLARYPKADLYGPGTGFPWSAFLPALADAVQAIAAQAAKAERERLFAEMDAVRAARERGCVCAWFRDTGGFRIADMACPVHGPDGSEPPDGPWVASVAEMDEEQR